MIKPWLLPTPYQLYASYWTSQPLDWTNPNVFKQSKPSLTWFEHFFAKNLPHCFLTEVPSEHTTAKFLDFTFQFLSPPWFFTTKFLDFTFSLFGKENHYQKMSFNLVRHDFLQLNSLTSLFNFLVRISLPKNGLSESVMIFYSYNRFLNSSIEKFEVS